MYNKGMVAHSPFLVFKWVAGTSVAVCEDKIRLCSSTYRLKLSSNRSLVYAYFSMLFFRYQIQNFLEYVVGGGGLFISIPTDSCQVVLPLIPTRSGSGYWQPSSSMLMPFRVSPVRPVADIFSAAVRAWGRV